MMNFGSKKVTGLKERSVKTSRIMAWVKTCIRSYDVDDSTIEVMVTELECTDPDCVPLETLVALLGKDARWTTKILKPLNDVTLADVEEQEYPVTWSSWVEEYHFTKDQPELMLWMSECLDAFDDKISELRVTDQLTATLIMEKAMHRFRQKLSPEIDKIQQIRAVHPGNSTSDSHISEVSKEDNEGVTAAVSVSNATSTIVSMRLKTETEKNIQHLAVSPKNDVLEDAERDSNHSVGRVVHTYQPPAVVSTFNTHSVLPMESDCKTSSVSAPGESDSDRSVTLQARLQVHVDVLPPASSNMVGMIDSSSTPKVTRPPVIPIIEPSPMLISSTASVGIPKRHKKGTRPRGCPCCDPDSIDNIVNKMIFLETPP